MMRRFLGWLLSLGERLVDDAVPEEDLHGFLCEGLQQLSRSIQGGTINPNSGELYRLIEAATRLKEHGFQGLAEWVPPPAPVLDEETSGHAGVEERVISGGEINPGVVSALSQSINLQKTMSEAQIGQMEALLRYVEVRRKAIRFQGQHGAGEHWSAVSKTSILFSRFAHREQDIRFLNAALKLNDWAYRFSRTHIDREIGLHFLRALVESEAVFMELTD